MVAHCSVTYDSCLRFACLLGENSVAVDMRFLQGNEYLARVFRALAGKKGYIDAEDLTRVLAAHSKWKGTETVKASDLKDLAAKIVLDIDQLENGHISRTEFMKMPRLRVGEAPALLMQAANNMRTFNAAAEVLRSARLDLYWSKIYQKVRILPFALPTPFTPRPVAFSRTRSRTRFPTSARRASRSGAASWLGSMKQGRDWTLNA